MIALLDIGNSRLKWQTRDGSGLIGEGSLATADIPLWRPTWAGRLEAATMSCVAGDWAVDASFHRLDLPSERVHVVQSRAEAHGIVHAYRLPQQLGADRFAAMVGAYRLGLGDCLVISAGTALCVDMLTADGRFLGGCILPGPGLMRSSLALGTAGVNTIVAPNAKSTRRRSCVIVSGITKIAR